MIVSSEEVQRKCADSPRFGQALTGKRIRSSAEERKAANISAPPQALILLRKLSQDGIRASALKGRLNTLSKAANQQHQIADKFICTVSERCDPIFGVLSDLSEALRADCLHSFPIVSKALDELMQSAMGVSKMLEKLTERKGNTDKENARLQHEISTLRQSAAERKQANKELEEAITSIKNNTEEKQSGRLFVESTTRPIEERAEQRREICLAIQNECKIQQSTNEELKGLLLRMQKAQEVWLNDQKVSLDKLHQEEKNYSTMEAQLQKETAALEKEINHFIEMNRKEEAAFAVLKAQLDSQGFCVDLLLSKTSTTDEETKELNQALASVQKQREELVRSIDESERLLPGVLSLIERKEAALREQMSKVAKAEEMHANLLQQIRCLKEEVIGCRAATEAAASRLQAVEKKKNKSKETAQEKANQIFMFLEEMQIYYRVEASPAEVAATATKGAAERLSSLRAALSATLKVEEEAKAKQIEMEEECVSLEKNISAARQQLEDSKSEAKRRELLLSTLEATRENNEKNIEQTKERIKAAKEEAAEKAKKLRDAFDKEKETELEKERVKWSQLMKELNQTNSAKRKEIAGEELAISDENFRKQIKCLRLQHEEEMKELRGQMEALKAKEIKRKTTTLGDRDEENRNSNNQIISKHNNSNTSRKKIHCRRLVGPADGSGASLSTPHLHALKEKLAMSSSQSSSKTRRDLSEAARYGLFAPCINSQGPEQEAQTRSTKAQKTGRRSGGENTFDIFAQ